jgi:RNA polymerase sigma-70 factor (ECF subfamily)
MAIAIIEGPNKKHSPLTEANFQEFYDKYHDRLCQRMWAVTRNRDAAEDVVALAFTKAYEKRETFRGEASAYTWLSSIAFREAMSHFRSQKILLNSDDLNAFPVNEALDDNFERSECGKRLVKALGHFPAILRQALTDHFIHGRSIGEISKRRRLPEGTVLSRIFNGKRHLRKAWEAG